MPEIKVEGYRELRADKPSISVTDEEVGQALSDLREQHATFSAVEGRPLAEGDFAQVSLDGQPKAGEGKPGHMDGILLEIGGQSTKAGIPGKLRGGTSGGGTTVDR